MIKNDSVFKDGDFVWVFFDDKNTFDWAVVVDDKLIYQSGGYDDIKNFDDDYFMRNQYGEKMAYIGQGVRNAYSFGNAKWFYDWVVDTIEPNDTNMELIAHGSDFIIKADKDIYKEMNKEVLEVNMEELGTIFGRTVNITA